VEQKLRNQRDGLSLASSTGARDGTKEVSECLGGGSKKKIGRQEKKETVGRRPLSGILGGAVGAPFGEIRYILGGGSGSVLLARSKREKKKKAHELGTRVKTETGTS